MSDWVSEWVRRIQEYNRWGSYGEEGQRNWSGKRRVRRYRASQVGQWKSRKSKGTAQREPHLPSPTPDLGSYAREKNATCPPSLNWLLDRASYLLERWKFWIIPRCPVVVESLHKHLVAEATLMLCLKFNFQFHRRNPIPNYWFFVSFFYLSYATNYFLLV